MPTQSATFDQLAMGISAARTRRNVSDRRPAVQDDFDRRGYRLGLGGGFYDDFLSRVQGTSVGLIYEEFLLEEIPIEPHDVGLDLIVTETATHICERRSM